MKKFFLLLYLLSTLTFISNAATLNLKLWLENYYCSFDMCEARYCEGFCNPGDCITDTIVVELHDTTVNTSVIFSNTGLLHCTGAFICTFPDSLIGKSYYIGIKHRNCIETWSNPVTMDTLTAYDFTVANNQSCGSNMILVDIGPEQWAFYQGDVNQDGKIDQLDSTIIASNMGLQGYHVPNINCDSIVDTLDIYLVKHSYYTPVSCTHIPLFISSNVKPVLSFYFSPNPATKNLIVSFSSPLSSVSTLLITNVLGQTVSSFALSKGEGRKEEDLSGVASGVYFVVLQTEEGRVAGRFIKE